MRPDAVPYPGVEWQGQFQPLLALPFGLATAPRIFTAVMGHTVNLLRYVGIRVLPYLHSPIFAATTALSSSRRDPRRSWNASVELSPACQEEIRWWLQNSAQRQRPGNPPPSPPGAHQPRVRRCQRHGRWRGCFVGGHARFYGPGTSHGELVERARCGIEFMTAFPPLERDDSSTLREL